MHQREQLAVVVADLGHAVLQGGEAFLLGVVAAGIAMAQELAVDQVLEMPSVAILPSVVLHDLGPGDGQQPGTRTGAGAVLVPLGPGADEGFLRDLVGQLDIGGVAEDGRAQQVV